MFSKLALVLFTLTVINVVNSNRIKRYTQDQCGQPLNPAGLVSNGIISKRDSWPYLVALLDTKKGKFFCGGSLITLSHILTAAHCLQEKTQSVIKKPSEVVAYLGKYDLNVNVERGSVPAFPSEFRIHEDWNVLDKKFDADIAIIRLDEEVVPRSNIYPVCMWTSDMKSVREDDGTVVGWFEKKMFCTSLALNALIHFFRGTSENQRIAEHENIPHEVKLKIVTNEVCYEDEQLARVISYRTFCAGGENAGPCRGI